ncbi:MAG: hypothetical protein KatS3mg031_0881 [Chitinophagales bacterium]|nr:MAG: hypothetical protein KatS3mg031_0881 [Chitinophagales bacterium]
MLFKLCQFFAKTPKGILIDVLSSVFNNSKNIYQWEK